MNQEYETVSAQVTSQDPLQPIGTVFAPLQGEENLRRVMSRKIHPHASLDQSALVSKNKNSDYDGRRGQWPKHYVAGDM